MPAIEPFLDGGNLDLARSALDGITQWGDEAALLVLLDLQKAHDSRLRELGHEAIGSFASAVSRHGKDEEISRLPDLTYQGSAKEGREALLNGTPLPSKGCRKTNPSSLKLPVAPIHGSGSWQLAAAALERSTHAKAESMSPPPSPRPHRR